MGNFKAQRDSKDLSQRKATYEANEGKILNVLNDTQKETYKVLKAERETKMKNHKGRHKTPSKK